MAARSVQPVLTQQHVVLRDRLRAAGLTLLSCAADGQVMRGEKVVAAATASGQVSGRETGTCHPTPDTCSDDWFADLLCASPLFCSMLKKACVAWEGEEKSGSRSADPRSVTPDPLVVELLPGLWLAPMALKSRRTVMGYAVTVIPTEQLLGAEQLSAICQASGADMETVRRRLVELPLTATGDVTRLAAMVRLMHEDQARLAGNATDLESVGKQLVESYEEMSLLYTIIQNMTVQERPERFVVTACQELLKTMPYAWIGVQFADDRDRLKSLSGRLLISGEAGSSAAELRQAARQLFGRALPDEPIVLDGSEKGSGTGIRDQGLISLDLRPLAPDPSVLGSPTLVQPVSADGTVVGLLIAGQKRGPEGAADATTPPPQVSSVDMKLLAATATHMAIFLENAALYDDLNAMFLGTLEALTASIDAKDRYTCGHSRRVAHLTAQLAQAIGLDEYTVGRMHIAGLVHDVGKIGVPEAVLLKPGKLNGEEYEWIRQHPEMGHRILRDIPQLNDILPGVLYHHERWDGRGYPEGLKGEAIPLVARLIGLADSFDAMSSTRTYRSALSRKQVLDEIAKCTGAQFDPALAKVFVKLDFSEFDRMVREHQAQESAVSGQRSAVSSHSNADSRKLNADRSTKEAA